MTKKLLIGFTRENSSMPIFSTVNYSGFSPNSTTNPAWVTYSRQLETWVIVNMVLCAFGSLLLSFFLAVIVINKFYRRGSGLLIFHLTVLELAMCAVHLPLNTIMTLLAKYHYFPENICSVVLFFFLWTQQAGFWTDCFLAVNRFIAVVLPHSYTIWSSKRVVFAMMGLSWFITFWTTFPMSIGISGRYILMPPWFTCVPLVEEHSGRSYVLQQSFGLYLPLGLAMTLYIIIAGKFKWQMSQKNKATPTGSRRMSISEIRAAENRFALAKVVFLTSFWHCLCYFPITVLLTSTLIHLFVENPMLELWMRTWYLMGYVASPIFFLTLSRDYRAGAVNVFGGYRSTFPGAGKSGNGQPAGIQLKNSFL